MLTPDIPKLRISLDNGRSSIWHFSTEKCHECVSFLGGGRAWCMLQTCLVRTADSQLKKPSQATEKDGSVSKRSGEQHQKPSATCSHTKQWGHLVPLGHFFHKHIESDHSLLMLLTKIWRSTEMTHAYGCMKCPKESFGSTTYGLVRTQVLGAWIGMFNIILGETQGVWTPSQLPFAAGWWHSCSVLSWFGYINLAELPYLKCWINSNKDPFGQFFF